MATNTKAISVKKNEAEVSSQKVSQESRKRLRDWLEEMKREVRLIHWTTKAELQTYTQIVVLGTFAFGLGVYIVDLMIHSVLKGITSFGLWLLG